QLFVLNNYDLKPNQRAKLQKKVKKPLTKPDLSKLNPELNSICATFEVASGHFNGFLKLSSLGNKYGKIFLPIKFHKNNQKLKDWQMKTSFCLKNQSIDIRWEKDFSLKNEGTIVGADSGVNSIVTLSAPQPIKSLKPILQKLSRKIKGSKSFRRAQDERTNFINYTINLLNFSEIKQINLEDVKSLRYKQSSSRFLSHFTYPAIRQKIVSRCEEHGVRVLLTASPFKSQRCSVCGWVQKKNRKGEKFNCLDCGHSANADANSAINQTIFLPSVYHLLKSGLNKEGFFWIPSGIYDRFGQELAVPDL
ncbi:MAG: zinc ribbon domain-containing protein, partial [Nanoarchaeota archaeon]